MKKLLLVALVVAATPILSSAQTKKSESMSKPANKPMAMHSMEMSSMSPTAQGTWLLGGNAGFTSQGDIKLWNVSPDIGYFIKDNWALGGRASILGADDGVDNVTTWGLRAFVRPYFGQSDMGKFFIDARLGFEDLGDAADTEFTYGAGAGYALFLNKSIALEFGAGYDKTGNFDGIFGANIGFHIHLKK